MKSIISMNKTSIKQSKAGSYVEAAFEFGLARFVPALLQNRRQPTEIEESSIVTLERYTQLGPQVLPEVA